MTLFQDFCKQRDWDADNVKPVKWVVKPAGFFFTDLADIEMFVSRYIHVTNRGTYTINQDGTVDIDGDCFINPCWHICKTIPVRLGHVKGSCYYDGDSMVEDLSGSPRRIDGDFRCKNIGLKTLNGAPDYVGCRFEIVGKEITSLAGLTGRYRIMDITMTAIKEWPDFPVRVKQLYVNSENFLEAGMPSVAQFREFVPKAIGLAHYPWQTILKLMEKGQILEAALLFSEHYPGEQLLPTKTVPSDIGETMLPPL